MAKINCKMALSLGELFFEYKLSNNIVNLICEHLTICKECRKTYLNYIKKHKLKKELYNMFVILDSDAISSLYKDTLLEAYQEDRQNIIAKRKEEEQVVDESSMSWTDFAKDFDIYKLAQLKCFRDFTREYNKIGDDGTFDYNDFNKYMAIKFCKQIDHLELCYQKEVEEVKNS